MHCKERLIWLPWFPTSSASCTVESHCLLCIPAMLRFSRTLVDVMKECIANKMDVEKYVIKVTKMGKKKNKHFSYSAIATI